MWKRYTEVYNFGVFASKYFIFGSHALPKRVELDRSARMEARHRLVAERSEAQSEKFLSSLAVALL
jgi:hypothetical protein